LKSVPLNSLKTGLGGTIGKLVFKTSFVSQIISDFKLHLKNASAA